MSDLYEQARAALDVNPAYGGTAWDYQRALRQILDLHQRDPEDTNWCRSCGFCWPCATAREVCNAVGVNWSSADDPSVPSPDPKSRAGKENNDG